MIDQSKLIERWKTTFETAQNPTELLAFKNSFRNADLKPLLSQIKETTDIETKRHLGQLYKQLESTLQTLHDTQLQVFTQAQSSSVLTHGDVMLLATSFAPGSSNIIYQVIDELVNYFKKFLFTVNYDSELTTIADCFDLLNIPKDHPSRNLTDTFYLDKNRLLRTHCTAATLRAVKETKKSNNPDIRIASFGAVFRKDDDDATHSHQFNQLDFMWIKKDFSLTNLKWFMQNMINHIFGENTSARFRLSHFPFTEPSFEIDIRCWLCQNGCGVCKKTRWIEVLGAGILHPQVMANMGFSDTDNIRGIAAGIGIERLVMLKHGISDIRNLYDNNFKFLAQFTD